MVLQLDVIKGNKITPYYKVSIIFFFFYGYKISIIDIRTQITVSNPMCDDSVGHKVDIGWGNKAIFTPVSSFLHILSTRCAPD